MTSVKMILSQWIVMFDHTHRGSCGRAVNRSFSPGMVWVSLQILQSLVGLGTLNPFPPLLFSQGCVSLSVECYFTMTFHPHAQCFGVVGEACGCVLGRRWFVMDVCSGECTVNRRHVLLIFRGFGKGMDVTIVTEILVSGGAC